MRFRGYVESDVNMGQTERLLSLVSGTAMVLQALARKGWVARIVLAAGGVALLRRGVTGRCPVYERMGINRVGPQGREGILVEESVTIHRPRAEVYRAWHHFDRLPRATEDRASAERVGQGGDGRFARVSETPLDLTVAWDTEITEEQEDEHISWQSLPGSLVKGRGSVTFRDAPQKRGTEVRIQFAYDPPGGSPTVALAKLLGGGPGQQVGDDLRRFKQIMETGEVSTVFGQSSGRIEEVEAERSQLKEQRCQAEQREAWEAEREAERKAGRKAERMTERDA